MKWQVKIWNSIRWKKRVELICGGTDAVTRKDFDVIFSNLTCEDIISLLPEYERLLAPGGFVICAGILKEKLPMLTKELTKRKWVVRDEKIQGMWAGIHDSAWGSGPELALFCSVLVVVSLI